MNSGTRRHIAAAVAATLATMLLCPTSVLAKPRTLDGTVTYRERMALPPSAIVEVRLVDVSLVDAPSTTIARTSLKGRRQVPIRYRLRFDDASIKAGRRYALQARITVDGRLWFTTTTHHAIFAGGADNTDILVERVRQAPRAEAVSHPSGRWLAEDIRQGGVIDRLQTVIEITSDGKVSGTGGCNRISGTASIRGDKMTFGPIVSTEMACAPAAMDQERKFFAALGDVRAWRIDPAQRKLVLLDATGKPLVVLARM